MNIIIRKKNKSKKSSKRTKRLFRLKRKFLEYYAKLPIQKLVAESIGVHETTISRWKEQDKRFANQIASAKLAWALDNVGKVKSREWLLERVMKDHFAEKKELELGATEKVQEIFERIAKNLPD